MIKRIVVIFHVFVVIFAVFVVIFNDFAVKTLIHSEIENPSFKDKKEADFWPLPF